MRFSNFKEILTKISTMIFVGSVDELKFSICTNRFLLKGLGYCATKYRTKQNKEKFKKK